MGALPFFSCAGRFVCESAATEPRRPRHAEFFPLLRRVRTFLSETTPRFVTFCKCLSLRNLVARGAGMVLCALVGIDSKQSGCSDAVGGAAQAGYVLLQVVVDAAKTLGAVILRSDYALVAVRTDQ